MKESIIPKSKNVLRASYGINPGAARSSRVDLVVIRGVSPGYCGGFMVVTTCLAESAHSTSRAWGGACSMKATAP